MRRYRRTWLDKRANSSPLSTFSTSNPRLYGRHRNLGNNRQFFARDKVKDRSCQGRERQLGADIRLILPRESRCLACFGGVTRRREVDALLRPDEQTPLLWSELRSGSLRSLNAVAVHFGLRLLEDLVDERVSESLWLRLEYEGALPGIRRITPTPVADCPLCRCLGWGDAIEAELPGLLATPAARMGGEGESAPGSRDEARS